VTSPKFKPSPAVAARRTQVLALRIEQRPYTQIAAQLGITESTAKNDYARALADLKAEQASQAHAARDLELAKLAVAEQAAWEVLRRPHITVQHGRVVLDAEGEPVPDDAPVLAAVDRILKVSERRARLLGLDAPYRVRVAAEVDEQIQELAAELELRPGAGGLAHD
jgi:DNA-binding CsgD family transcriptional regulator